MSKRNNIVRYVIKDSEGRYINSYSTALANNKAYKYAKECARLSKAIIYSQDKEGEERKIYDNS